MSPRTPHIGRRIGLTLIPIGCLFATASALVGSEPGSTPPTQSQQAGIDPKVISKLDEISNALNAIAEAVKPSVVNIQAMTGRDSDRGEIESMLGGSGGRYSPVTGTGSGVIFDEKGFIVTNHHLVGDVEVIRVTLADGRKFRAKLVSTDPMTDLAVIKIEGEKLKAARFGDSDLMQVGHLVLAIGSPFRLGHSVSHGIVSAIGRSDVDVDIDYKNWLQTDAPINPGNSGGPLINTHGEVIGINVAIATDSGGNQGVGFAIPSNSVMRIAKALQTDGRIVRGFIGVVIEQVDDMRAEAYGLTEPAGVFINAIGPKSPAEKSGLKAEDIVLSMNGKKVSTLEQLREMIAATRPGERVDLAVWRKGRRDKISVIVGKQSEEFSSRGSLHDLGSGEDDESEEPENLDPADADVVMSETGPELLDELGIEMETITPELAKKYGQSTSLSEGVVITRVDFRGEAFTAKLKPGDVIVRANDTPIRAVTDMERLLTRSALRKGIRLKIRFHGDEYFTILHSR
jgi:serine protease Do